MINALLMGIMTLITNLVATLLKPIDLLILQFLPDLSNAFTAIGNMLNFASQYVGFAVSVTGLSNETLSLIVLYYTFKLSVPLMVSTIKTAIKWYDKLKP